MVSRFGTDTSPSSGSSSPTTIRNNVVLPAPFGPTSPTFSPGLSWNEASTNSSCLPYCLLILENEIIHFQATRNARGWCNRQPASHGSLGPRNLSPSRLAIPSAHKQRIAPLSLLYSCAARDLLRCTKGP